MDSEPDRVPRPDGRRAPGSRALVLAGAGAAGNAWELGVVAGLASHGLDVTDADLVIGTSAGATAAAQIVGCADLAELYAAVLAEGPPAGAPGPDPAGTRAQGAASVAWSDRIIAASDGPEDLRRRLGSAALEVDASGRVDPARWRQVVARRLGSSAWPDRRVLVVAVDARTGEPVLLDRESGVDLVDAVAASTSNPFGGSYPAGGRRLINGGYRRSENADLAAGAARVLVLSPFGGRSRMPAAWGMDLATQVAELRAAGSEVEVIVPGEGAAHLFDENAMDPSTRVPAARSGFARGAELADRLRVFWS